MFNSHYSKKGFTLVELIVVITILAILWTLGFVSFQWYTLSARDSTRITEVRSISKLLNLFKLKTESYPLPDNSITITASWGIVWYQWFAWSWVFSTIWYSNEWVDPLDGTLYTYYALPSGRSMQMLALMEKDSLTNNLSPTTTANADLSGRYPMVYGNKLWIITWTWNISAQSLTWVTTVDLTNGTETYVVHVNNSRQYQWSWNDLRYSVPLSSCQRILDANLAGPSWYYTIYPIDSEPKEVYCRFDGDDGYTLIARSVNNAAFNNTPFGWFISRGTPQNDSAPYSLWVDIVNIPFEDVYLEVVWEWKERSQTPWLNGVTVLNVTDIDLFNPSNETNSLAVNDCVWGGCVLFNRWWDFASQESYYFSPSAANLNTISDLSDLSQYSWSQRDGLNRRQFWASFPHAWMIFVK